MIPSIKLPSLSQKATTSVKEPHLMTGNLKVHIIKNALRKRLGPRIKMPGLGKQVPGGTHPLQLNQMGKFKL